jgi:hypothetical protein
MSSRLHRDGPLHCRPLHHRRACPAAGREGSVDAAALARAGGDTRFPARAGLGAHRQHVFQRQRSRKPRRAPEEVSKADYCGLDSSRAREGGSDHDRPLEASTHQAAPRLVSYWDQGLKERAHCTQETMFAEPGCERHTGSPTSRRALHARVRRTPRNVRRTPAPSWH